MIGDDDRRQKSQRHREAAKSRWEDTPDTLARRLMEGTVDGLNWLVVMLVRLLKSPFTLGARLGGRGQSNSGGRSGGRRLRRRD